MGWNVMGCGGRWGEREEEGGAVCGVWCVVTGVWCVVCGGWCVVCGGGGGAHEA